MSWNKDYLDVTSHIETFSSLAFAQNVTIPPIESATQLIPVLFSFRRTRNPAERSGLKHFQCSFANSRPCQNRPPSPPPHRPVFVLPNRTHPPPSQADSWQLPVPSVSPFCRWLILTFIIQERLTAHKSRPLLLQCGTSHPYHDTEAGPFGRVCCRGRLACLSLLPSQPPQPLYWSFFFPLLLKRSSSKSKANNLCLSDSCCFFFFLSKLPSSLFTMPLLTSAAALLSNGLQKTAGASRLHLLTVCVFTLLVFVFFY